MTTWHQIEDPSDRRLDELAAQYKLHSLHIEDCRHRNQNAKVEAQDGYLFVVLKAVELDGDEISSGDLDLFLGSDYLITVPETECVNVKEMLARVRSSAGNLRTDQLFHRIVDGLVDTYYPVLDRLSDRIEALEEEALTCPDPPLVQKLFTIRRTLVEFRRILANSRDVFANLLRNQHPQIGQDLAPFMRDVYDHVARNLDTIELQRDFVTGATELYLSSVANRTNQVMKVLTVFGTIATPALVITGLYGMNLEHLPFAHHPHSWGIVMTMILGSAAVMLLILRKLRWL